MDLLLKLWKTLRLPKLWQLKILRMVEDQFLVGVTGVIFSKDNTILLLKHTYRKVEWSLPGGYIKAKEHPKEALEREIEEETGLIISADTRYKIRTDRDSARLDIVYIGALMGGEFKASHEVSEAGFFTFDTLPVIRKDQLILIEKIMRERNEKSAEDIS